MLGVAVMSGEDYIPLDGEESEASRCRLWQWANFELECDNGEFHVYGRCKLCETATGRTESLMDWRLGLEYLMEIEQQSRKETQMTQDMEGETTVNHDVEEVSLKARRVLEGVQDWQCEDLKQFQVEVEYAGRTTARLQSGLDRSRFDRCLPAEGPTREEVEEAGWDTADGGSEDGGLNDAWEDWYSG